MVVRVDVVTVAVRVGMVTVRVTVGPTVTPTVSAVSYSHLTLPTTTPV